MDCTILAMLLLLGVLIMSIADVADGRRGGDTSIVKGPNCNGISKDKKYSANVASLIDKLVDETKNVGKKASEDYKYSRSYPADWHAGYATVSSGGATCDEHLAPLDCWGCLGVAKEKFKSGCDLPVSSSVELKDCSMWFGKYRPS